MGTISSQYLRSVNHQKTVVCLIYTAPQSVRLTVHLWSRRLYAPSDHHLVLSCMCSYICNNVLMGETRYECVQFTLHCTSRCMHVCAPGMTHRHNEEETTPEALFYYCADRGSHVCASILLRTFTVMHSLAANPNLNTIYYLILSFCLMLSLFTLYMLSLLQPSSVALPEVYPFLN